MAKKSNRNSRHVRRALDALMFTLGSWNRTHTVTRAYQLGLAEPRHQKPAEAHQTAATAPA